MKEKQHLKNALYVANLDPNFGKTLHFGSLNKVGDDADFEYDGVDLGLTLKEFTLMKTLIGNAGVTVPRETLFREGWKEDFMGETRTLDMHIASLRDKIKKAGGADCIVTVRGVGYRYENK